MSTLGGLSLDAAMFLQKRAASKLCVFGKSFLSEGSKEKVPHHFLEMVRNCVRFRPREKGHGYIGKPWTEKPSPFAQGLLEQKLQTESLNQNPAHKNKVTMNPTLVRQLGIKRVQDVRASSAPWCAPPP